MHTKRRKQRPATATVELALVLPLLMFLFVVALDYGRIFYYSQILENCARSGALYGSDPYSPLTLTYSSIRDAALAEAADIRPAPEITWRYETDGSARTYIVVTAAWTFETLTNYPGIPNRVALQRRVRMPVAPAAPQ
jgi:Flp pilus assembly protein TadG